jgi:hypothetical protein
MTAITAPAEKNLSKKDMPIHLVYALVDSREPDHVRYVGKTNTENSMARRLRDHVRDVKQNPKYKKSRWISGVINAGYAVESIILVESLTEKEAMSLEIDLIKYFGEGFHELTNTTIGGEGVIRIEGTTEKDTIIHDFYHIESGDISRCTIGSMMLKYGKSSNWFSVPTGRCLQYKGWTNKENFIIISEKKKIESNIYTFVNNHGYIFVGNRKHISQKIKKSTKFVDGLVRGDVHCNTAFFIGDGDVSSSVDVSLLSSLSIKNGFSGVKKKRNSYVSGVTIDGSYHYIGTYKNEVSAAAAYDLFMIDTGRIFVRNLPCGHRAYGNIDCNILNISSPKNGSISSLSKSGYRGVRIRSEKKPYARIKIDKNDINLGTFPTPELAAQAYDDAAFAKWGFDCYLNFPERFEHLRNQAA